MRTERPHGMKPTLSPNKKIGVCILCFMFLPSWLFSDTLVSGSLECDTGFIFGSTNEYVIKNNKTISNLKWQEMPMPSVAINGRLNVWHFFIALNMLTVVPLSVRAGIIEDFDYLLDDSDALSNYSNHDLYTDKHFNIALSIGYQFSFKNFEIEPLAGLAYYTRKWAAVDGYLQYPENENEAWNENTPKDNVTGTGISYEQLLRFPFLGLQGKYFLKNNVHFSLRALFYPYIWVEAIDSHFVRSKQFFDTMQGGLGFNAEITVTYYMGSQKNTGIMAGFGCEGFYLLSGETASNSIGMGSHNFIPTPEYNSSMESTIFHIKLGIIINKF